MYPWVLGSTYGIGMLGSQVWRQWEQCKSDPSFDFGVYLLTIVPVYLVGGGLFGWIMAGLNRFSHEEVTINEHALLLTYRYCGLGQTRTFAQADVQNVRLTRFLTWEDVRSLPNVRPFLWANLKAAVRAKQQVSPTETNGKGNVRSHPLCFDYRGKTVKFGCGLDETGARELLSLLLERLPVSAAPPASGTPASASRQAFSAQS